MKKPFRFCRIWPAKGKIRFRDLAPVRLILTVLSLVIIGLYYLLRGNTAFMAQVYRSVTKPYHVFMARLCSYVSFSVAELTWTAAIVFCLVYLIVQIVLLVRRSGRGKRIYRTALTLLMVASLFWAGFSLFWSPCYDAPTFAEQSGISDGAVSAEDLASVTRYIAALANTYSGAVTRDADGVCVVGRASALDRAAVVYRGAVERWPFLAGAELRPKAAVFSYLMSSIDFTGYFFPMTGEANINVDSPSMFLPETAEHEISHQRGIAKEQECNFIAAAACLSSDDAEYRYSGALMAYTYLANALYLADNDAWKDVVYSLNDQVKADLNANNNYWAQFEKTVTKKASNQVYGDFLAGNGQTLRLKSYGACVDLLVNYYAAEAKQAQN